MNMMMKNEVQNKKKSEWSETLAKAGVNLGKILSWTLAEIFYGFRYGTIPAVKLLLFTIPIYIVLALRLDCRAIDGTRFEFLYPYNGFYWIYAEGFLLSPWIIWGLMRAGQFRNFVKQLTITFYDAGLVTSLGRIPQFVSERPIDDAVREIVLHMNGSPPSAFNAARERLSECFGAIEDIRTIDQSRIAIQYSHTLLPENTEIFDVPQVSAPATFVIGKTRSGLLTVNLTEVPHLLIGGRTRSGKSTFIRQMVATLLAYSPELRVTFIDLKYLLEGNAFDVDGRRPKRMHIISTVDKALFHLVAVSDRIRDRAEFLVQNGCGSIEDLAKRPKGEIKWTAAVPDRESIFREVVIIDEAAELFLAGAEADVKEAQQAKRLAIGIAAKGRAVGIHLVLATQRPDKSVVDMQIKTNLVGRVCFSMTDNASSMTILDNVRGAQLPSVPGRVIWRADGVQKEVQTLHLTQESLKSLLVTRNMLEEKSKADPLLKASATEKAPSPNTAQSALPGASDTGKTSLVSDVVTESEKGR